MQHAHAVDVVELAQPESRQVQQRRLHPVDAVQSADARPLACDGEAGAARIEMHDPHVGAAQLLGQEDRPVAGSAARHEDAEAALEAPCAAVAVMVEQPEVVEPGPDQALGIVARIARGIGKVLVLPRDDRLRITCHAAHVADRGRSGRRSAARRSIEADATVSRAPGRRTGQAARRACKVHSRARSAAPSVPPTVFSTCTPFAFCPACR